MIQVNIRAFNAFQKIVENLDAATPSAGGNAPECVKLLTERLEMFVSQGLVESFQIVKQKKGEYRCDVYGKDSVVRSDGWGLISNSQRAADAREKGVVLTETDDQGRVKPDFHFVISHADDPNKAETTLHTGKYYRLADSVIGDSRPTVLHVEGIAPREAFFKEVEKFARKVNEIISPRVTRITVARAEWDAKHPAPETPANG